MMDFIVMTLSFTVAILLASGFVLMIIMQPKVLKSYTKYVMKVSNQVVDEMLKEEN